MTAPIVVVVIAVAVGCMQHKSQKPLSVSAITTICVEGAEQFAAVRSGALRLIREPCFLRPAVLP